MITLLTYPAGFGQFSLSPFCVKAAALLQLSGAAWQRKDQNDPRKMPHAKLPVIVTDDRTIADTANIRSHLEAGGADFDSGLTDVQKAQAHAIVRMAEEHLYFQLVMDRWGNDDVWPTIREAYFGMIPAVLRRFVTNGLRRAALRGLHAQGIARFTPAERMERVEPDLQALSTLIGDKSFLFGERVTGADLSVWPMLAAMRATPVRTDLSRRVAEDPVLAPYIDRCAETVALP